MFKCLYQHLHVSRVPFSICFSTFRNAGAGAHHAVKGEDEAALGVLLRGRAVAPVPPALQVIKPVVREVQHRRLIRCLLPAYMWDMHKPMVMLQACSRHVQK